MGTCCSSQNPQSQEANSSNIVDLNTKAKAQKREAVTDDQKSLYEKIGGEKAVEAVVGSFYGKILTDPLLAPFFKATNMKDLEKQQKHFLTVAFGGPNSYKGATLRKAH
mmetsp:Transcript_15974/g.13527  ORF Transcript_15974/g.13527 Transcript_15974/m.13527 type:complete len:109 (+) Transcript_15974:57-383(+)